MGRVFLSLGICVGLCLVPGWRRLGGLRRKVEPPSGSPEGSACPADSTLCHPWVALPRGCCSCVCPPLWRPSHREGAIHALFWATRPVPKLRPPPQASLQDAGCSPLGAAAYALSSVDTPTQDALHGGLASSLTTHLKWPPLHSLALTTTSAPPEPLLESGTTSEFAHLPDSPGDRGEGRVLLPCVPAPHRAWPNT